MPIHINLNGNLIELATEFEFLGCTIDQNIDFRAHVKQLVKISLFFKAQHGFGNGFSCETALHFISDQNKVFDKKMISVVLYIDFRKAFDLVNSTCLLRKLFHYSFCNDALLLLQDYLSDRRQIVKRVKSEEVGINIGVPQGSIIGHLFSLF